MITFLIKKWKEFKRNDPVYNCVVYKTLKCSHVDGPLCDMKTCEILANFMIGIDDIFCPVCGYYCFGKGGMYCIDKQNLKMGMVKKIDSSN